MSGDFIRIGYLRSSALYAQPSNTNRMSSMEQTPQSQLKLLVAKGKEQGYLTYAEVNDHLPQDIVDSDQIEDIIQMINDMGIQVVENARMPMTLSWLKVDRRR